MANNKKIKVGAIKYESLKSNIKVNGIVESENKSDVFFDSNIISTKILVNKYDVVSKNQKLVEVDLSTFSKRERELTEGIEKSELLIEKYKLQKDREIDGLNTKVRDIDKEIEKNTSDINKLGEENIKNKKKLEEISQGDINLYNAQKQIVDNLNNELSDKQNLVSQNKRQKDNLVSQIESIKKEYQCNIDTESINIKACKDEINEIKDKIERINNTIVSPIDGIVTSINIPNLTQNSPGLPSFTIMDAKNLKINIKINEAQGLQIKLNQPVRVKSNDYNNGQIYKGHISYISPIVEKTVVNNQEQRAFAATVSIENADNKIKLGMQCECEIDSTTDKGLVGSFNMLKEDKDGEYSVFIYNQENNTIRQKKIKTGLINKDEIQFIDGVVEGEKVVIDPQPNLKDGDIVNAVEVR